jgi:hypothetical protein
MLEKDKVKTMTTALFVQKVRRALLPMWKATLDTILLGSLIVILLLVTSILFTYPWLILLTYALVYLAALVLRLRQAAHESNLVLHQDQDLDAANETLVSEKSRIGWMLFWGSHPRI